MEKAEDADFRSFTISVLMIQWSSKRWDQELRSFPQVRMLVLVQGYTA